MTVRMAVSCGSLCIVVYRRMLLSTLSLPFLVYFDFTEFIDKEIFFLFFMLLSFGLDFLDGQFLLGLLHVLHCTVYQSRGDENVRVYVSILTFYP